MLSSWRLVKSKYAESAFNGQGAAKSSGRWNSHNVPMVYTSATPSLAALETLVHLNPHPSQFPDYSIFKVSFEASLVQTLTELAAGWDAQPHGPASQHLGDQWSKSLQSVVLAVPSVTSPLEFNYLLNPVHPDFSKLRISPGQVFHFDSRLKSLVGSRIEAKSNGERKPLQPVKK